MSTVRIVSLNVRGLRDTVKRGRVFRWLRSINAHIICLQETNFDLLEQQLWEQQWGEQCLFNNFNAILVNNREFQLSRQEVDVQMSERILVAKVSSVSNNFAPFSLGSIYIPAQATEREEYINMLGDHPDFTIDILVGDCNLIANPVLDHSLGSHTLADRNWPKFQEVLQNWELADLLRGQDEQKKQYTHWQHTTNGVTATRIDYFFVSVLWTSLCSSLETGLCPYSDHRYLTTEIRLGATKHGKSYWKFNTSLTKNEEFRLTVKNVWQDRLEEYERSGNDMAAFWESSKSLFQGIGRFFGNKQKQHYSRNYFILHQELRSVEEQILSARGEGEVLKLKKQQLLQQLKSIADIKFKGLQIRSRAKWLQEGEKQSQYFHRLISARRKVNTIHALMNKDGRQIAGIQPLMECCTQFYTQLFAKGDNCQHSQQQLLSFLKCKLTEGQVSMMEMDITEAEVWNVIQNAPSNSSPGPDGLSFEFYQCFREILIPFLCKMFNQLFLQYSAWPSTKKTFISLIYKEKGMTEDLKNWHPISLINCDLKLFTKILANRLQLVVHSLVHQDQAGFIKGRVIQHHAMRLQQILELNKMHHLDGYLIFLDQEKAYDRSDWDYLLLCLQAMGFGTHWIKAIGCLYQGLQSSVIVNGFISKPFAIHQGLRQGDPLSPLLYDLILEPLLCFFRASLQGILLPLQQSFKSLGFADDVVVGVSSREDCQKLKEGLLLHQKASNAKLNESKSQSLPLNDTVSGRMEGIGQVLSRTEVFKYLGYPFHPKCHPLPVTYFNSFLDVLQKTITAWQKRNLTLPGRVLVLNSRLLSKLWYLGYLVQFPSWFFKRLMSFIRGFIWQGRRPQISMDIVFTAKCDGGLGLINPENQITATKAWWMQQHAVQLGADWVQLSLYIFQKRYLQRRSSLSLFGTLSSPADIKVRGLWKEIYCAWKKLMGSLPVGIDPDARLEDWIENATLADISILSYKIRSGRLFLQGLQYPTYGHSKWDLYLPTPPPLPWAAIWKHYLKYQRILPHPQSTLWWRLLHHNIITAKRLAHYVPGVDGLCRHCRAEEESIHHLFYSCTRVKEFWNFLQNFMSQFFSSHVEELRMEHLLWSCSSFQRCKAQQVLFIGLGLWSIYRVHNAAIFSGNSFSTNVIILMFKYLVSNHLTTLAYIAKCNNQLPSFFLKWLKPPFTLGLFGAINFM